MDLILFLSNARAIAKVPTSKLRDISYQKLNWTDYRKTLSKKCLLSAKIFGTTNFRYNSSSKQNIGAYTGSKI